MPLIKENQAHTKHLQKGLEYRLSKIAPIRQRHGGKRHGYNFSFCIMHRNCFSKFFTEYSSQTLGINTIEYVPFISSCTARNASLSNRFIRFLCTLFPCFFPTEIPIVIFSDGRYIKVKEGENARFPLWNSRPKSVCFFNLKYFILFKMESVFYIFR